MEVTPKTKKPCNAGLLFLTQYKTENY